MDFDGIAGNEGENKMNELLTLPTRSECEAAEQRAYEEHYKVDWIDDVDEADMRELMRLMWSTIIDSNDELRDKYLILLALMDRSADIHCQRYAVKNAHHFLKG